MAPDFLKQFLGKKSQPAAEPPKGATPATTSSQISKSTPARNPVKDTLFGNLPLTQWPPSGSDVTESPWAEFDAARNYLAVEQMTPAIACWQSIIATPNLEALHYLQAWHFLRRHEVQPPEEEAKKVYGVIGEQGKSGVLIAAFLDGQARLYGDQGQGIAWAHPDTSLDPLIESVLGAATALMQKVKQSDPQIASSRLSFNSISVLTPSGVYTKTGSPGSFEATPLIKPVAEAFGLLIKALMEKAGQASK